MRDLVEIGMGRTARRSYDFDDIDIVPSRRTRSSKVVSTSWQGRNFLEYTGDTGEVCQKIMAADAILIGTPIFQASIPGTLKNVFDLLPQNALRDKIVGMLVTAGSSKHFLIAEQQLKPILAYMKAVIVQTYVFIEDRDFEAGRLTSGDVLNRIDDLVSDIILLTNTYKKQKEIENEAFDF